MYNIDFKTYDFADDDLKYDECGNSTEAILIVGKIKIPLCRECIDELKESVIDHTKPHFCYECEHFGRSPYDYTRYGGTCLKETPNVNPTCYGECGKCVGHLDTCKDFILKEKEK